MNAKQWYQRRVAITAGIDYINHFNSENEENVTDTLDEIHKSALQDFNIISKKIEHNIELKYKKLLKSSAYLIASYKNADKKFDPNTEPEKDNPESLIVYTESIEQISSELQAALIVKNYADTVEHFSKLIKLKDETKNISDPGFRNNIQTVVDDLFSLLISHLEEDVNKFLILHNWPAEAKKKLVHESTETIEQKYFIAFKCLLNLHQFQGYIQNPDKKIINFKSNNKFIHLPVQIILKTYQKKFSFHFYGTKKTNNILKPEWYLTQLLLWAKESQHFVQSIIQKQFDKIELSNVNAFGEFLEGLVCLACDKICADLPTLLNSTDNDMATFIHLIDEAVNFQLQLTDSFQSFDQSVSCIDMLCVGHCFEKWIAIEKNLALLRMDEFLSSPKAWSYCQDDDPRMPRCGDHFFMLINTMADRNQLIKNPESGLVFANLIYNLMEDMRYRLVQIWKKILSSNGRLDITNDPTQFVLIINLVATITDVLNQWSMSTFYDRLYHYGLRKARATVINKNGNNAEECNVNDNEDDDDNDDDDDDYLIPIDSTSDDKLMLSSGSFFGEIMNLYKKLKNDMMTILIKETLEEFIKRSRSYQQNKFIPRYSFKDFVSPTLTPQACDFLNYLRRQLSSLKDVFSPSIFDNFWQQLTTEIDEWVTENIIFYNHYNETGAMQLKFDLCENLIPIFSAYTTKPANYFKSIKESCHVLTLSQGLSALLRDTLLRSMQPTTPKNKNKDPLAALNEVGVQKLTLQQIERLMSLRIDWPSLTSVAL